MKPEISVIVPIYNVEKYLPQCIDSILAQTFINFEVILVDDGSADNCGEICDEYAEKDNRIIVIHKKNAGVSAARNIGIEAARGEYLMFVDSDDFLECEMLEIMYKATLDLNPDCVASGLKYYFEKSGKIRINAFEDAFFSMDSEFNKYYKMLTDNFFLAAIYSKLYKKSIILNNNIRFDERYSILEDGMFVIDYLKRCKKCRCISKPLYFYRQFESFSLMKKYNRNAIEALREYERKGEWLARGLIGENVKAFTAGMMRFFYSSVYKLYFSSDLSSKEKLNILKQYVNDDVCDKIFKRLGYNDINGLKNKINFFLYRNKMYILLHFVYLNKGLIMKRIGIITYCGERKKFNKETLFR